VLAFDVEQSRREIGLRTALGASRDRLVGSFVQRATKLTATGSLAGLTVALVLAPRIEPLLFQTSARDPSILGGVAVALMLVGVAAAGIPAWRAARVDPNVVLQAE
jgi:ABC-type antimicrobial peptide transport system permease subunit